MAKCLLFEGIILCLCGVGCFIGCYFAVNIIDSTFNTACLGAATTSECLAGATPAASGVTPPAYTPEQCKIDLMVQGGCKCGTTISSCDCSSSVIMGQLAVYWPLGCYAAGAVGFFACVFLTGLPAIISSRKKVLCCNVKFYSIMSGLLFLPFLVVGGVMCFVAALAKGVGPVGDFMKDCEKNIIKTVAETSNQTSTGDAATDAQIAATANQIATCGAKAFCKGITELSKDMFTTAIGVGIPFFVAGVLMFFGMYACCCCKGKNKVEKMDNPADINS